MGPVTDTRGSVIDSGGGGVDSASATWPVTVDKRLRLSFQPAPPFPERTPCSRPAAVGPVLFCPLNRCSARVTRGRSGFAVGRLSQGPNPPPPCVNAPSTVFRKSYCPTTGRKLFQAPDPQTGFPAGKFSTCGLKPAVWLHSRAASSALAVLRLERTSGCGAGGAGRGAPGERPQGPGGQVEGARVSPQGEGQQVGRRNRAGRGRPRSGVCTRLPTAASSAGFVGAG